MGPLFLVENGFGTCIINPSEKPHSVLLKQIDQIEVLGPSQSSKAILSMVSLPNYSFPVQT